jgi:hypothetical protein
MNGFQAFEGGLALLGVESDKVQEALLRVQSVMALTQGINGILEAKDAFSQLGVVAKGALKGIKTELIATGIGAFVVALGTAVAYWDDIKELATGVSKEQAEINLQLDKDIQSQEHKIDMLDVQQATLKLQGKSQKEINALVLKELNIQIAKEEQRLTAEKQKIKDEIESTKNYQNYLAWYIRVTLEAMGQVVRLIALPFDLMIGQINLVSEALGKGKVFQKNLNEYISEGLESASQYTSKLIFNADEVAAEGQKTIQEMDKNLATLKNKRDQLILDNRESDKNAAADRANTERAAAQESIDLTRQRIDKEIELMEDGYEKEKRILEEKAKREKEDLAESIKDKTYNQEEYAKTQKLIDDNLKKDLKNLDSKYFDDTLKARGFSIQALKDDKMKELEIEVQANQEKAEKQKQFDEEEKARIKALSEFRLNAAKDTLQMVSDLTELFAGKSEAQQKKAFQIQKAVNIANAVIDTYKAANTALASSPPPFNYIAMAAAITAGLLNVKKIASQKFQASGSSGGGGGGSNAPAGAPMTANFSTIGSSGINQLAQLQQKPTQAYVVSGEVTSAQALDRNRVQNATL